jgi:predicted nucleic acid-binding protein
MIATLVDASFFVALYNLRESAHRRCVETLKTIENQLVTCEACITEALHLLNHASAAADAIFTSLEQGALETPFKLNDCPAAVGRIIEKYRDTPCDFADACLIAMADELGTGDILTLDSDFKHYRWKRTRKFNLLIPLD